jgi:hypothetical protein
MVGDITNWDRDERGSMSVAINDMLEDWLLSLMSTLAIGFWTPQLIEVDRHEGNYTCRYNTHGWIV